MAKVITLPTGYEDDITSSEFCEAINADLKGLKAKVAIITSAVRDGEWCLILKANKRDLIELMAHLMACQGGPSINMDEVKEMANDIWAMH